MFSLSLGQYFVEGTIKYRERERESSVEKRKLKMFGCEWFYWNRGVLEKEEEDQFEIPSPQPFSLPSPIPQWPPGEGFGNGRIGLGEIEVLQITKFNSIWSSTPTHGKTKGVTFYRPIGIPDGFYSLGHYCQPDDQPLMGYLLVARDLTTANPESAAFFRGSASAAALHIPALAKPLSYTLVWSTNTHYYGGGCIYIWLPNPPNAYKSTGFVVTDNPNPPELDEVRCVRADYTESCETCDMILETDSINSKYPFRVWNTRASERGMLSKGVSAGTFFCSSTSRSVSSSDGLNIACLKNLNPTLNAMPNLDQVHALIQHYGPTVFFHPDEAYFPSSVSWFFKNGAVLCRNGEEVYGKSIDSTGSNLPRGGKNDGEFWIDLPDGEDERNHLKVGCIESTELYVHVKPAVGGTFTDIAMWLFCPFNGPATIKAGLVNIPMSKIGQHVSDWEHFTLRVSNFTGQLWRVYFSQHSGGEWVDASGLEFTEGNKAAIYSSKHGHASFPHPGSYIHGSSKLSIGVRNDAARSKYFVDSSIKYQIIAAEYLGDEEVAEPFWLQYMREWGPTIVYDSRSEIDKIICHLPFFVRFSVETLFDLFPTEIYGEEGPTGPKEKDNWVEDERC